MLKIDIEDEKKLLNSQGFNQININPKLLADTSFNAKFGINERAN